MQVGGVIKMLTVEPRSLGGVDELPSLWTWRCRWLWGWTWGFRCEADQGFGCHLRTSTQAAKEERVWSQQPLPISNLALFLKTRVWNKIWTHQWGSKYFVNIFQTSCRTMCYTLKQVWTELHGQCELWRCWEELWLNRCPSRAHPWPHQNLIPIPIALV